KKQIFHYGPIWGTNNLGEFLAIVFLLAILKKANDVTTRIYTDSAVAMKWVKTKQVKSKLMKNAKTKEVWALVEWAIAWLNDNMYTNKILKWETEKWGEIPADFGRK
ncbi:ribonuclease H, partial [bacterium]|nr:ribonuclease H [bacterium]